MKKIVCLLLLFVLNSCNIHSKVYFLTSIKNSFVVEKISGLINRKRLLEEFCRNFKIYSVSRKKFSPNIKKNIIFFGGDKLCGCLKIVVPIERGNKSNVIGEFSFSILLDSDIKDEKLFEFILLDVDKKFEIFNISSSLGFNSAYFNMEEETIISNLDKLQGQSDGNQAIFFSHDRRSSYVAIIQKILDEERAFFKKYFFNSSKLVY